MILSMKRSNLAFIAGLIVILVFWIGLGSSITAAAFPFFQLVFPELSIHSPEASPFGYFLLAHISFLMLLTGIFTASRLVLKCTVTSLATDAPAFRFSLAGRSFLLWFILFLLLTLLQMLFFPSEAELTFSPKAFFLFLPAVLILTPLQALSEELLFRAYLRRWASRFTFLASPLILSLLSGVLFLLVHTGNPEFRMYGSVSLSLYYILYGAFLMAVSIREGGIESAVGIHGANNIYSLMVMNYEGSVLPSPSLWTAAEVNPAASTFFLVLAACAYWLLRMRTKIIDSSSRSL